MHFTSAFECNFIPCNHILLNYVFNAIGDVSENRGKSVQKHFDKMLYE